MKRGCLRQGDREIELRPKSFEVLRHLVENAGRLVAKDEFVTAIWPNVTVTDESLARCVADVRLALGDGDQPIIRTVPRRGYLFNVPVCHQKRRPKQPSPLRRVRRRPRRAFPSSCCRSPTAAATPSRTIFADGVTESLTTDLSRMAGAFVIARNTAFTYKGKAVDAKQIGRELGVRYLLEGSVRHGGDRLRINVQLVDAQSGTHLWAERFDRNRGDLFEMQDEIVARLARVAPR